MSRFLAGIAIVALLNCVPGLSFAQGRFALVLGNSNYQHVGALPNPKNDAETMAVLFKSAGFTVDLRNDLGIADLRKAVREFAEKVRQSDMAVVFYAGHGIEVNGTNFLIPVDAKLANDFDVEDETVSLDRVLQSVDPAKRLRLIILDACRDNPFVRSMKRSVASRSIGRGLSPVEPATTDTLIAFAAKGGSTAADGTGANSPYTAALIKHLTVPGLDLRIALGRVRDEVISSTGKRQEPFVYGSLGGSVISLTPEADAVQVSAAAQVPDANAEARRDYELAAKIATKDALESFLGQHKTGFYAELARSQIAKLSVPPPIAAVERSNAAPIASSNIPGNLMERAVTITLTEVRAIPSGSSMPKQMLRSFVIDLKKDGMIATNHSLSYADNRLLRSWKGDGRPDEVNNGMKWSVSDNQITGMITTAGFTVKPTVKINGTNCTATAVYEPPAGASVFKLADLSGRWFDIATMKAESVTCKIGPVGR